MPPRNRALLRIGIELRGATSDATPRVSPTIFSRQPEKQTWISFKTLKISAGYDPALTPALETRTVSKYEGIIYIYLFTKFITNEGIIVDFRSAERLPYEHWSVADTTRTPRQTSSVVRVFFPMAPSQA